MITGADVVVAGSGPAGSVAAYVLAKKGYQVLLVDPCRPSNRKVGECLLGAAGPMLRDLQLEGLLDTQLSSMGTLSCWGSVELIAQNSIQDPLGPGWHLQRAEFDAALRNAAVDAGVLLHQGLFSKEKVPARWYIDATGRAAVLARRFGAKKSIDDDLEAVYTWVASKTNDQDSRTIIEAIEDGWWYSAQVEEGVRVLVFHSVRKTAQELLRSPNLWQTYLEKTLHLRNRLPEHIEHLETLRSTEAGGSRLNRFYGDQWLAIGDAALAFDPISSQGIFKAIYTGIRGAEAVDRALQGDESSLRIYADRLEQIRLAYLRDYQLAYNQEKRWPHHSFWKGRQLMQATNGAYEVV